MASTILAPVRTCNLFAHLSKCKNSAVLKMGLKAAQNQTEEATVKLRATRHKTTSGPLQINQFNLLEPGFKVLQICSNEGSWSKLLADETNATGKEKNKPIGLVISISADELKGVQGVHNLPKLDFMQEASQDKISQIVGRGNKFDVILSDWVPPPSGVKKYDSMRMAKMVFCVYLFIAKHLRKGGSCLLNVEGAQNNTYVRQSAKELFKTVHFLSVTEGSSTKAYLMGKELCSGSGRT